MSKLEDLASRLGDIPLVTQDKAVRAKSRDFFWYSPILKEKLDHVTALAVARPRDEAEVVAVLAAAHALDLPVTPRGGGTGNYGQAMPLAGGVVLDMTGLNAISEIGDGRIVCGPGGLIGDLEVETLKTGQEFRMHPSTRETATIGGFISGGSGGVGSIRWGMLYEPGNILRVRVATLEAMPRLIDLEGPAINLVHHAYGTTGVITEVEMPLAPAQNWVEMLIAFDDWGACVDAGWRLACQDGLYLKELAAIEAPAPHANFTRHRKFLCEGDSLLCILAAPNSADTVLDLCAGKGVRSAYRSDQTSDADRAGLPHLHHLCWNHTTLRALKADPAITYLQLGGREDDPVGTASDIARMFPGEIVNHIEFSRGQGRPRYGMLPLVRFASAGRLSALLDDLEAIGVTDWSPHVYTWEEGNNRDADPAMIAMKRAHDPKGLLNPGKLIGWDNPDYRYDRKSSYAYPGMQERP